MIVSPEQIEGLAALAEKRVKERRKLNKAKHYKRMLELHCESYSAHKGKHDNTYRQNRVDKKSVNDKCHRAKLKATRVFPEGDRRRTLALRSCTGRHEVDSWHHAR